MTHPRQDPARRCRPLADWPEPDRQAWTAAQAAGDILDPGGPAAGWAPHTRRGVVSGWGHFLTWLDQAGELRTDETPAARLTPPRLGAYVAALRERGNASQSILSRLQQLDRFLAAVAPGRTGRRCGGCWPACALSRAIADAKRARLQFSGELFALGIRSDGRGREQAGEPAATGGQLSRRVDDRPARGPSPPAQELRPARARPASGP